MSSALQYNPRLARRKWRALVLIGAIAALAPGARAASKPAAPNVSVPQQWTTTDQAVKNDTVEDMSRWWDRLHDATLTRLIERALANSPDVHTAQAKLRESRARQQLAVANRWPSLTSPGSATRQISSSGGASTSLGGLTYASPSSTSSTSSTTYLLNGQVDWDLDLAGAKRSAQRAAEGDYRATEADLHDTRVSLTAEVAQDYVQLRANQVRLEIARRNEASQSETLQITQWREQAGLVNAVDVEQARSSRDQTRAQIPTLEIDIWQTQHALEALAGTTPGTLTAELAGGGTIPSPPDELAIGIPADTLHQRPDIRAAEERILAESARLGQQRAARYPSLSFTGSIGLESIVGGLLGGNSEVRELAANFTHTIFDFGRIRQNIEIQSAVQQQAVITYESTVLTALKEVEDALISFSKSRDRLAALTTATEAARNAATLAQNRYSAGLVDFQTVLDTERTALSLEDTLAATQADRTTAVIQLYQALGGGWTGTNSTPAMVKGN
jgi:NodT family efflux transporter outer membrane factor (OMF) lipoprotein